MSLKKKTLTGLAWSFASQGGKQVCQFIITVVLTRLLSPADFGLMGMVTVFTAFVAIFNDLGVSSALIQKQDTNDRHLSSAFWLNVLIGLILAIFFGLASFLIAKFYNKQELKPLLMVMSLNFIFASFTVIQQTILTKEMNFKALMIRDIGAIIFSGSVGIWLAYHGYGVWSLVWQLLVFTVTNGILLWILSSWKPKLIFSVPAIKEIFHFSANMTGFSILNYFARNVDYLLIGKFLGAEALGYYTLAYRLMLYPLQNISQTIGRVMFPAFSKIQNDAEKLRNNYLKMIKAISLVTFPMLMGLLVMAPEFVEVMFGNRWKPAVPLIQILCFCGVIQSVGQSVGNIRLAQGLSAMHLKMGILNCFLAVTVIYLSLRGGLVFLAIAYTVFSWVWYLFSIHVTLKPLNIGIRDFILVQKISVGISVLMVIFMVVSKYLLMDYSGHSRFIVSALVGMGAYIAGVFIFKEVHFSQGKFKILSIQ